MSGDRRPQNQDCVPWGYLDSNRVRFSVGEKTVDTFPFHKNSSFFVCAWLSDMIVSDMITASAFYPFAYIIIVCGIA